MSAMVNEHASMTIGEVLSQLTPEFPDVSISKIRFLESEGLIHPQRAPSGYRRFTEADIEQLRLVLLAQRDRYLPLRVIKQHLREGTLRDVVEPAPTPRVEVEVVSEQPGQRRSDVLAIVPDAQDGTVAHDGHLDVDPKEQCSRRDAATRSGLSVEQVDELAASGVLKPDEAGRFAGADVAVCQAFAALRPFGVEVRHLRQVKNAASRDSALISNAVRHLPDPQRAEAIRTMLDALSSAHYWQVTADLNREPPAPARPRRGN